MVCVNSSLSACICLQLYVCVVSSLVFVVSGAVCVWERQRECVRVCIIFCVSDRYVCVSFPRAVCLCVGIEAFFGACRVDVVQLLLLLRLDVLVLLHPAGVLHVGPVG